MSKFDKYGHDYELKLEDSIRGLGSVDSALKSKLQILRPLLGNDQQDGEFRVLDFGCGTGLLSAALTRLSMDVAGVDVSMESLRNPVSGAGRSVLFDGHRLPFKTGSFPFAVASCVFHHIPAQARPQVLREMNRVLVPGGTFILIEHNPYNPVTRFVVNRCEFDKDAELLSMSLACGLLESGNFTKTDAGYFYTIPPINKTFSAIDAWFARIPLGAQYYCAYRKVQ